MICFTSAHVPPRLPLGALSGGLDPSKWIIIGLHKLGFATGLRRARKDDMLEAVEYMQHKHAYGVPLAEDDHWDGPNWTIDDVQLYIQGTLGRCVLLIDDLSSTRRVIWENT